MATESAGETQAPRGTSNTPPESVGSTQRDASSFRGGRGGGRTGSGRGRGNRFGNRPFNRGIGNFKGEVPEVGAVLGTVSEQRENKDRFKIFQDKLLGYIKRSNNYRNADDLSILIRKMKDPWGPLDKQRPKKSTDKDTLAMDGYEKEYEEEVKLFVQRKTMLRINLVNLYSLIWGQLTEALQSRIKGDINFEDKDDDSDAIWLLEKVKLCSCDIDHTSSVVKIVAGALRSFFSIRQRKDESLDEYRSRWEGNESTLLLAVKSDPPEDPMKYATIMKIAGNDEDKGKGMFRAMCFILGLDMERYGGLVQELDNDLLKGNDSYPTTVPAAYDFANRYVTPTNQRRNRNQFGDRRNTPHVSFVQINDPRGTPDNLMPGANGLSFPKKCFRSNKYGHIGPYCPYTDEQIEEMKATQAPPSSEVQALQLGVSLAQANSLDTGFSAGIKQSWIIIDSGSTCNSFCNEKH